MAMPVEITVSLIAGAVALGSAAGTIWSSIRNAARSEANSRALEQLTIDYERFKHEEQRQKEISAFREPLARAVYDLQSRIFNILRQDLIDIYLVNGGDRERTYVVENTAFLVAQYLCWTELVRRELQFIDLGEDSKTRKLLRLQDTIYGLWATDQYPTIFRIFAGEQRAIGEILIMCGATGPECMGYGAFLKAFDPGASPLIDALRNDVLSLGNGLGQAKERLASVQHALIDLLEMLDPDCLRFPEGRRTKA